MEWFFPLAAVELNHDLCIPRMNQSLYSLGSLIRSEIRDKSHSLVTTKNLDGYIKFNN